MSNSISPTATALSLYRSCLRQIRRLPTEYLRQFFRIKIKDDVRKVMERARRPRLQQKRLKLLEWELRKIQSANKRDSKAFEHVLDLAYGRRGKLKQELTEPLLSDPNVPPPEPIIRGVEKSRPPVYSREMLALLGVPGTRANGRRILPEWIAWPPQLPERAKPYSKEAQLWGPFSKRREVNTRWKFFEFEVNKLYPPLQVTLEERPPPGASHTVVHKTDLASLRHHDVRPLPFQDSGVFEEAEAIAGEPSRIRLLTRKEKKALAEGTLNTHAPSPPIPVGPALPSRFVRRRFKALLSRIPILTYAFSASGDGEPKPGKYGATFSPVALANHTRYSVVRLPNADPEDVEWLSRFEVKRRTR